MPNGTESAALSFSRPPGPHWVPAPPLDGLALMRPVYWVIASLTAGIGFRFGGLAAAAVTIAAMIGLWAFAEPRASLWLATAYMVFLFVFCQETAPLGEDLPAEFLFWGIGIALICVGLVLASLFSSQVDWSVVRRRCTSAASLSMFAVLLVILASSVYGLGQGNQLYAVLRQLFGCLLLPVFYFAALALFRTERDAARWLRCVSWVIALGSLWYAEKLSFISLARGMYYREQSPLVMYSGAVAVAAFSECVSGRKILLRLLALVQCGVCLSATLLMGSRTAFGSFLAAAAAVLLLNMRRRWMLALAFAACLIPTAAALAPYALESAAESRGIAGEISGRFIFPLEEDASYRGRVAQTTVVLHMVGRHPILGAGMGSENSFLMPDGKRLKVASVDNGWGYLLLKTGVAGLLVFLALIGFLLRQGLAGLGRGAPALRRAGENAPSLAFLGIFFYALSSFLSGPIFFHFTTAPFVAVVLGALAVGADSQPRGVAAPERIAP